MTRSWSGNLAACLKVPLLLTAALCGTWASREEHDLISVSTINFGGKWKYIVEEISPGFPVHAHFN